LAAEQAVSRAAYAEAASMLDAALKLLDKLRKAPSVCAPSWRSAASKPWWPLSCTASPPGTRARHQAHVRAR